jgi:hypothetical protein
MAGETTARSGIDAQVLPLAQGPILNAAVWTTELATTQLELADVIQMGYIPSGVTLIGFVAFADDLDSNGSPALVWKITVGASDVKTGITIGQATAVSTHSLTQFLAIDPVTTTAATLVSVTFTTAAATAVAGTLCLTPVYIGN